MPSLRRENVRHATLLFCAEGVRAFVGECAEKSEQIADERENRDACGVPE